MPSTSTHPHSQIVPAYQGNILLLGINEGPNFVALHALTREVMEWAVLIFLTDFADFSEQLNDSVFGHASQEINDSYFNPPIRLSIPSL
jgi:hypothetical protein